MTRKQMLLRNSFLGLLFVSLLSFNTTAQQWDTLGVAGFSDSTVLYQSLGVYNDTVYVAYADESNGNRLIVKRYDGNIWGTLGNSGISAGSVRDVDLLVINESNIYVAYVDEVNGEGVTVMHYDGSSWAIEGSTMLPSVAGAYARRPSLAYSSNGSPHVAYDVRDTVSFSSQISTDVLVYDFNGTVWTRSNVALVTLGSAAMNLNVGAPSLNFNPLTNRRFVAFEFFGIEVNWSTGSTWSDSYSSTGDLASTSNFSSFCDLEFAPNGDMYVAFSDADNEGKTTVAMFDGTVWTNVGPAGFTATKASYVDLDFDDNGSPYVTQQDTVGSGLGVSVYRYDGSAWGDIGSGNVYAYTGSTVSYTNLVIDNNIAYLSFINEDKKSTVLRYVLNVGVHQIPTLNQDISIYPNPTKEQLTIEGVEGIESVRILTMDGKVMQAIIINSNTISVETLPQGIYTIEVITREGTGYKNFIKQ